MNVLVDFEERVRQNLGIKNSENEVHPGIIENFKRYLPQGVGI